MKKQIYVNYSMSIDVNEALIAVRCIATEALSVSWSCIVDDIPMGRSLNPHRFRSQKLPQNVRFHQQSVHCCHTAVQKFRNFKE